MLAQWSLRSLEGGSVPSAASCPAVLKGHPSVTFLSSMGVGGVAGSAHRYPETDQPCGSRQRTTLKGPMPATEKGDASQALPQHPHSPTQAARSPEQTWIFWWPAGLTYPDPHGCQQGGTVSEQLPSVMPLPAFTPAPRISALQGVVGTSVVYRGATLGHLCRCQGVSWPLFVPTV